MPVWLSVTLLAVVLIGALVMVPLGLPGLWIMLGAGLLYNVLVAGSGIGMWTLGGCAVLVVISEVLEFTVGARYARKYGGSKRASWGSIIGGIVGAFVGVPVPIIGSVIAALIGAFVGAVVGEATMPAEARGNVARVGAGAVIGRAVAAAMKTGMGVVIAGWLVASAVFARTA